MHVYDEIRTLVPSSFMLSRDFAFDLADETEKLKVIYIIQYLNLDSAVSYKTFVHKIWNLNLIIMYVSCSSR